MAILNTNVKNANVKFLNGLQSDLNDLITDGGAIKGAFYLTSDTHRLYIGQEDNTRSNLIVPVPVNEGVTTVANVAALPSVAQGERPGVAGGFYYALAENILCVYNGNQWVQINPDTNTTVDYFYNVIADTTGKTTLTYILTDNNGNELSQGLELIGAGGISISSVSGANFDGSGNFIPNATKRITITGDSYSLTGAVANNTATLTLASSDTNKTPSTVQLQGGSNISVTTNNGKIVFNANDTYVNSLSVNNASNSGNGFIITAGYNDNSGNEITASFDPILKLNGGAQDYHFVNGKVDIPVYTKREIDTVIRQLNAMTFQGVIGPGQRIQTVPTTGVSVGDTYKIGANTQAEIPTGSNSSVIVSTGDQIIAQGTEYTTEDYENNVINDSSLIGTINPTTLYWAYIPSGDDTVTTSTYIGDRIANGIALIENPDGSGNEVMRLTVNGDNKYTTVTGLTSTGITQALTVSHNEITSSTVVSTAVTAFDVIPASTAIAQTQIPLSGMTIPVITQINRDAAGHVKNIVVSNYRITDTTAVIGENDFETTTTSNSNNDTAKISTRLGLIEPQSGSYISTAIADFVVKSDTLSVSASTATFNGANYQSVSMEIVWGSF